jgi:hypothetical protein
VNVMATISWVLKLVPTNIGDDRRPFIIPRHDLNHLFMNSQKTRSSWKFGTNTLVVLSFLVHTTINHWCYVHIFLVLQMVHNHKWSTTIVSVQLTFALWKDNEMIESLTMQQSNHKTKNQIETKVRREILPLISLRVHIPQRRCHQRIKNDHHIFHQLYIA